ncbi:MAG TPA: hypothetical protein ENO19_06295 [Halothiobacillaceae bacterium]|nr:hypothetical protein [Halothiobacillaceae bacterium]
MRLMHHCGVRGDRVEVLAADRDQLIASFRYPELDRFIAEGTLSVADLFDPSTAGRAALCRKLALLACARACRHGMSCLAFDCPHHPASRSAASRDAGRGNAPNHAPIFGAYKTGCSPR